MPKPDTEAEKAAEAERVRQAQQRLATAKEQRDNAKAAAEHEFWLTVATAIDSGELKQSQACEALGYQREYVRRQVKKHRSRS